ncbi:chemotaxis protein CheW [Ramlibacter rhizophilus]|uniref:Chemotaxis protein CheW n=1 Tax=Ramlibacter rhizophilus TaxID=1781167 RepID=A0A4Z0BP27_9BURK|nr:chemotaxis protein CheW [Ramlibacter rhizophilus]TFZ01067.1 chemotaxis protein CheW [Ramlibacter rhizophilus]
MANREALRELQTRLAERLQAARQQGVQASWLAVEIAGGKYLFPLAQSGEIFSLPPLQPVPYTKPWFLGVANLRGGLWGVVDLAAFMDAGSTRQRADGRTQPQLVTLNAVLEVNCAVLIERLGGLRSLEAFAASEPAPATAPSWFGSSYIDFHGTRWQEINLQAMSQQPQFLSISA